MRVIWVLYVMALMLSLPAHAETEGPYTLEVSIEGVDVGKGTIKVALYDHEDAWLKPMESARARLALPLENPMTLSIYGLPEGTYALAVFQDENNDHKLNRRFGLLPKEPYGFSNDVGRRGPAKFRSASFELRGDMSVSIRLNRI